MRNEAVTAFCLMEVPPLREEMAAAGVMAEGFTLHLNGARWLQARGTSRNSAMKLCRTTIRGRQRLAE